MRRTLQLLPWLVLPLGAVAAEAPAPASPSGPVGVDPDEVYEQGKALFDQYAPDEIKQQFEFPRRADWDDFIARFQHALGNNDLSALAGYEPQARSLLAALQAMPGYAGYVDWLDQRVDYAEAARLSQQPLPALPRRQPVVPVPYYDLWLARVKSRPPPSRAAGLLARLKQIFAAEGMPASLVWVAEAESAFNPSAVSPAGAKGLFQLMPATARDLGLRTWLPDERGDPEKNARASARYLKQLHARFRDWPLALAAYNAGPGRVQRLLEDRQAKTFREIAPALPAETRMYVPKVLALVTVRAGVTPDRLAPPAKLASGARPAG